MAKEITGYGRKRPQLNIPLDLLNLDSENPRLADEYKNGSQLDLLSGLYEQFDLEEIAYSMSENGYFDEEPIVVVAKSPIKDFQFEDYTTTEGLQKALQTLTDEEKISFTVVEGNRRTATAKLLLNDDLRKRFKIKDSFPKVANNAVKDDLKVIPAIFYRERSDISAYLGVRHIAGLLKWEAYAKAVFLSHRIEESIATGKSIDGAIKDVQKQTADRSDVIKKQYLCFKILEVAQDELEFDTDGIKDRFSLMTVALNAPSIREYIGAPSARSANFEKRIIPVDKIIQLENVLTWIFGNGKDKAPIITDSRKITSRLAPILADKESTEYLLKYDNVEEAYERSGSELTFLLKKLNDAKRNLGSALGIAYKYKTTEVSQSVDQCIEAAQELKKMISA